MSDLPRAIKQSKNEEHIPFLSNKMYEKWTFWISTFFFYNFSLFQQLENGMLGLLLTQNHFLHLEKKKERTQSASQTIYVFYFSTTVINYS